MKATTNKHGFFVMRFTDVNGRKCCLNESLAPAGGCIWLGTKVNEMHLSQKKVAKLLPFLTHFAIHGKLPKPETAGVEKE
jgi:hypothetical protein